MTNLQEPPDRVIRGLRRVLPDYLAVADWTDLDHAFTLPGYVQGDLRVLYETLKLRLHRETEKLPMPTAFQLVVERSVWFYIEMKFREQFAVGHEHGYQSAQHAKDVFERWVRCNDAIVAALKNHSEAARTALGAQVRSALTDALAHMPEQYRNDAGIALVGALERAGL